MNYNPFAEVQLCPPAFINVSTIFYVAVRRIEDNSMLADMTTRGATLAECEFFASIEDQRIPDWSAKNPIVMFAAFRLADGYLENPTAEVPDLVDIQE